MGGICRRIPPARSGGDEPLSQVLRRDCADLHAAIEANPHFSRMLSPDLRREDYVALPRRRLPFHGAAEAGIARHLGRAAGLGVRARQRPGLILADLAGARHCFAALDRWTRG